MQRMPGFRARAIHIVPSATLRGRDPLSLARTAAVLAAGTFRAFRLLARFPEDRAAPGDAAILEHRLDRPIETAAPVGVDIDRAGQIGLLVKPEHVLQRHQSEA